MRRRLLPIDGFRRYFSAVGEAVISPSSSTYEELVSKMPKKEFLELFNKKAKPFSLNDIQEKMLAESEIRVKNIPKSELDFKEPLEKKLTAAIESLNKGSKEEKVNILGLDVNIVRFCGEYSAVESVITGSVESAITGNGKSLTYIIHLNKIPMSVMSFAVPDDKKEALHHTISLFNPSCVGFFGTKFPLAMSKILLSQSLEEKPLYNRVSCREEISQRDEYEMARERKISAFKFKNVIYAAVEYTKDLETKIRKNEGYDSELSLNDVNISVILDDLTKELSDFSAEKFFSQREKTL